MFNLQGSELVIILLLALVVLGPEKLPDAMRKAGQFYAELKKMSTGFQTEFRAAVEEPLRELRDTANTIRDSADFTKLQNGERDEKPKSAEMVAPADPSAVPTDDLPFGPEVATVAEDEGAEDDGAGAESVAGEDGPEVDGPEVDGPEDDGAEDDGPEDDGQAGNPATAPVVDDPQNQVPFSSVVISNPTPQRKHVAFAQDSSVAPGNGVPVDESPVAVDRSDSGDQPGAPAASTSPSGGDATVSDPGDAGADTPAEDAAAEPPE